MFSTHFPVVQVSLLIVDERMSQNCCVISLFLRNDNENTPAWLCVFCRWRVWSRNIRLITTTRLSEALIMYKCNHASDALSWACTVFCRLDAEIWLKSHPWHGCINSSLAFRGFVLRGSGNSRSRRQNTTIRILQWLGALKLFNNSHRFSSHTAWTESWRGKTRCFHHSVV